ncbi:M50 family metallopeptidase [Catellatospora bangladeshensis]|uniref:Zinc metalloprotease n=1 Tax=Catellatospora bangladeshensis TaxID=310355 RepID=A0A8J3JID3_9ACTN|nr:M50 family metallopeptidase [Catellatospora bangladeshensis]GIF85266.1 peptidase M50 [Catellatospora bangladeshensis]
MTDSTPKSASRGERRSGFQVGRIFGFPLRLSASWVFMALFITWWYGEGLGRALELSGPARYLAGLGFVACLLLSVLLHELGHALTARHYGIGVKGITLDLLGGYTEFDHDSPRPGVELATALAGPVVSALVGVASVIAAVLLPSGTVPHQIAFQLALCNIIVAVYNALPGWPLDGGRALRAVVWGAKGDRDAGLLVAGWSGRVVAVLTALLAAVLYMTGWYEWFGLIFGLFVAFSIWQGAAGAVMTARVRRRYPLVDPVRLARPLFVVPTGTSLAEAARRAAEAGHTAPVLGVADPDGRLIALVVPAAAAAVPEQRRPWVTVETVARGIDAVATIPSEARGAEVIKLLRGDPATPYLVVNGEDVVGVLTIMDVVQVLDPAALKAAR